MLMFAIIGRRLALFGRISPPPVTLTLHFVFDGGHILTLPSVDIANLCEIMAIAIAMHE